MDDVYGRKETEHLIGCLENVLQMYHLSFAKEEEGKGGGERGGGGGAGGGGGCVYELWKVRFLSLFFHFTAAEMQEVYARFCFPEGNVTKFSAMFSLSRSASHALRHLGKDAPCSDVYHLLMPLPMEALLLTCALTYDSQSCKNHFNLFWSRLQRVKVEAKGADLIQAGMRPGPAFARIFARLLDARLDGQVATKEEEVALAKRIWDEEKKAD